jgi:UDP-N-acetylglucosamine diphosphorylase/glucosamine-1-phosphate N-acetyltransferase
MFIVLFDNPSTKEDLLPFTYTRPVAHIRIGILTIAEKWQKQKPGEYSFLTEQYLQKKYPRHKAVTNLYINGSFLPNSALMAEIESLKENELLSKGEVPVAFYGDLDDSEEINISVLIRNRELVELKSDCLSLNHLHDIFTGNRRAMIDDFMLLTRGRKSTLVADAHTAVYNPDDIFVEEGASIKSSVLNAETGPIYIGKNTEIGEGSIIRGATAICEGSVLNLGTRIRGDSTIGPFSKVGGEISNSVVFGYSSKSHDGFLGNSVVGEWCNIGADTNTSNLKNNYADVKIWNYAAERFVDTGRRFCGLMMGDHSKCGINTMFNTGTVVGVSANIFGSGFPRTFIPSFSWGGAHGMVTFQFNKALDVMPKVMERRKKTLDEEDVQILAHIFEITRKYRKA